MKEKTKIKIIIIEVILVLFLSLFVFFNNYSFLFLIVSNSMNPLIYKNDIVLVRKNVNDEYLDKIIAYYNPLRSMIMVHRAVDINGNYYITKGDNALMVDFYQVPRSRIIGNVVFIIKTSKLLK